MKPQTLNINIFKPSQEKTKFGKHRHTVNRGTLPDSNKNWICKEMEDPENARSEILAQEFFRLIIPHQPETRLAKNKIGIYYILSEEVPGFTPLPLHEPIKFTEGVYTGLGQALICALFLQEIDLKNGNIGIDDLYRIIKIDGDWCFASKQDPETGEQPPEYHITPKTIESLPYPVDFYTYHWLDLRKAGISNKSSEIIDPISLSQSPQFLAEKNEAIFKICLLSDQYIEAFTDTFISAGASEYITLIKERREALKNSALQTLSFCTYLTTQEAKETQSNILKQMTSFQVNNQFLIEEKLHQILKNDIQTTFTSMETSAVEFIKSNPINLSLKKTKEKGSSPESESKNKQAKKTNSTKEKKKRSESSSPESESKNKQAKKTNGTKEKKKRSESSSPESESKNKQAKKTNSTKEKKKRSESSSPESESKNKQPKKTNGTKEKKKRSESSSPESGDDFKKSRGITNQINMKKEILNIKSAVKELSLESKSKNKKEKSAQSKNITVSSPSDSEGDDKKSHVIKKHNIKNELLNIKKDLNKKNNPSVKPKR